MARPESRTGAGRDARGRWTAGHSGNAGGRRASLVAVIAEKTRDGADLVAILAKITRGQVKGASVRDRIAACRVLLDHGWARPMPKPEEAADSHVLSVHAIQEVIRRVEEAEG